MRTIRLLVALFAVVSVVLLVTAFAQAQEARQRMSQCEKEFNSMDTLNKGYLSYNEYLDDAYGPGGHMGLLPSGNAPNNFYSMDTNNNGEITSREYCAWTAG